jgi:predicted phosphodiesterase
MLLLHLSDIHFREPDCVNPDLDPNRPYRTRTIQDVRSRVADLGPVDGILIGGDIAYKGHPEEYAAALTWLNELAAASGCSRERIYVVPGNHDVDRSIIMRSARTRNVHAAILCAQPLQRERELRTQFADPYTGDALLAPLAAYNEFAAQFGCQVFSPDRLYWKQDLDLQEGVTLRIYGLTSTLLSGVEGRDDVERALYLSPLQTVLDPIDNVVNLVLCHHPPHWFMDHDEINDAIIGRAKLHLFGHKHQQRIRREIAYARFEAGAVNPDRNEPAWQPAFNLIDLNVVGNGADRALQVNAHLLRWQVQPEGYTPVMFAEGPIAYHTIPIPGSAPPRRRIDDRAANEPQTTEPPQPAADDLEAAMGDEPTRNLIYRFWQLSVGQRREITLRLNLIEETELGVPEPERYGRAFLRASERGILDELATAVRQAEEA